MLCYDFLQICFFKRFSTLALPFLHSLTFFIKGGFEPKNTNDTSMYPLKPLHRGAIYQFVFRWIYYRHSSKSTGKKTCKTHLCALYGILLNSIFVLEMTSTTIRFSTLALPFLESLTFFIKGRI